MPKCRAFSELLGCAGLGLALLACGGLTYAPTAPVRPTITTQPSNQAVGIGQLLRLRWSLPEHPL